MKTNYLYCTYYPGCEVNYITRTYYRDGEVVETGYPYQSTADEQALMTVHDRRVNHIQLREVATDKVLFEYELFNGFAHRIPQCEPWF